MTGERTAISCLNDHWDDRQWSQTWNPGVDEVAAGFAPKSFQGLEDFAESGGEMSSIRARRI